MYSIKFLFTAKRAAAHDGTVDEKPVETVIPTATPEATQEATATPSVAPTATPQADSNVVKDNNSSNNGIAWYWLIIVGIGALAVGGALGYIGKGIIKKKK